jgi:dihydroflavonol-4-reductase
MSAYAKSKTLAEHAAWDFVNQEGAGLELSVVNPTAILGPLLSKDYSTSIQLIIRMMNGAMPGLPHLAFGVVDVRDVADLHVRAMTNPAADNQRFLAVSGDFMTLKEIAVTLKSRLGPAAKRVPTRGLPNWLVRIAGNFDPGIKAFTPELGKIKNASSMKAQRLLDWSPRPREDAIVATGESLIKLGMVAQ